MLTGSGGKHPPSLEAIYSPSMAKTLATVFGVIFVLVGLLGFFANPIVGTGALFEADAMHNIVHLLIGIILLGVAYWSTANSGMALKVFGIIYLVLAVLGFVLYPDGGTLLGLVETNAADNWLHLVLGIILVAAGWYAKDGTMGTMGTGNMQGPRPTM